MKNPEANSSERTLVEALLHYLSILLKFRWLIVGITAAVAVIAVAFSIVSIRLPPDKSPLPNTYKAQSILLLQQPSGGDLASTIMSALGAAQPAIDAARGFDTGALVLLILQSRSIIDQVIAEFDITHRYHITQNARSRSREVLLKSMGFSYNPATSAITVSCENTDPDLARDIVNRVVALTDLWFSQNRGYAKKQQMQLLEQKIGEVKTQIADLENSLKDLQKKYGVLTAQDLGSTQAAAIADLRSQLILKEIEIKNYSNFSIVDDPHLQQLNQERQNIQDLIDQTQQGISGTQASTSDSKSLPDVAQEFSSLTLELDIQRRIYNTLSPQYEAAKLTTESAPVFQVLEAAEAPDMKSGPQRSRIIMIAVLLAFLGDIVLSFLISMLSQANKNLATTNKQPKT